MNEESGSVTDEFSNRTGPKVSGSSARIPRGACHRSTHSTQWIMQTYFRIFKVNVRASAYKHRGESLLKLSVRNRWQIENIFPLIKMSLAERAANSEINLESLFPPFFLFSFFHAEITGRRLSVLNPVTSMQLTKVGCDIILRGSQRGRKCRWRREKLTRARAK